MTFSFRPAVRQDTPLIIGLAGPTKSGKTMSAHRLAQGLANGGVVAMLNAEGARGHQYADKYGYVACDIEPPFSPSRYTEALKAAQQINPSVLIIDSMSHMHDGPGGLLEMHDDNLDRMAGNDKGKRDRMTWTAWIAPKKDENEFIYTMLSMKCPVILCFRAKEKLKIVPGKPPIDLGWQPIGSERIAFETLFTLLLPPHSKGVPDLSLSEMREPFDTMVPEGMQIDEKLGRQLAQWATGKVRVDAVETPAGTGQRALDTEERAGGESLERITDSQVADIHLMLVDNGIAPARLLKVSGVTKLGDIQAKDYARAIDWVNKAIDAQKAPA